MLSVLLLVGVVHGNPAVRERFDNDYNKTMEHFRKLCGMFPKDHPKYENNLPQSTLEPAVVIPKEFDARKQWPKCAKVIGLVRDQSSCGSCWAFGTTEALNDRICIKTGSQKILSPLDTASCCKSGCMGCSGGNPANVWSWFESSGTVTGGNYQDVGKGTSCDPYSLPTCAHHENSSKYKPCPAKDYPLPACSSTCHESGYGTSYSSDKHRASSSYQVSGVERIQTEIMTNGPVTGGFVVYDDFVMYRKGVYQNYVFAHILGNHAIKIVGWGTDPKPWPCYAVSASLTNAWCTFQCTAAWPINCQPSECKCDDNGPPQEPLDYWLVLNSWNEDWGNGGWFKILKGVNHDEIESHIFAGRV